MAVCYLLTITMLQRFACRNEFNYSEFAVANVVRCTATRVKNVCVIGGEFDVVNLWFCSGSAFYRGKANIRDVLIMQLSSVQPVP